MGQKKKADKEINSKSVVSYVSEVETQLPVQVSGFEFGLSMSQTSRYFTTWMCFLYYLEINWMPSIVRCGLHYHLFLGKVPTTYTIIDASEFY